MCGMACLSNVAFRRFIHACASSPTFNDSETKFTITIPHSDFIRRERKNKTIYKNYIIIHDERLQYPIVVYRIEEDQYRSFLLQCTHQGATLQVFGDIMECPAHGSEFNHSGEVIEGPAQHPLPSFEVKVQEESIKIIIQ